MRFCNFQLLFLSLALLGQITSTQEQPQKEITFKGGASIGFGELVHSSDTSQLNYSGNRIQNVGAHISFADQINKQLQVSAGLGILEKHYLAGRISDNGGRTPFQWNPYIVNASFNYAFWNLEEQKLNLTGGYFPYSYNSDVKDLGLYLTRGPVYPGILIASFDSKYTKPIANTMGMRLQHVSQNFEQNLILSSEIENYPLFDLSLVYLNSIQIGKSFKIGAGINFYHLIPIERKLTSPDTFSFDGSDLPSTYNGDPNSRVWIYVDTLAHDTTFLSFAGTKVMANFSFDPKVFFASEKLGADDLKIYGEAALIGLDKSQAYTAIYGDYLHRMPIMMGFNFPVFNYLDHLSLEVEWYGAKFKDDLSRLQASTGNRQSPLPVVNSSGLNLSRDDWKWAVHASKTWKQINFTLLAANDHARSGGTLTSPGSEWQSYFVTPKDWYWIGKLAFFF